MNGPRINTDEHGSAVVNDPLPYALHQALRKTQAAQEHARSRRPRELTLYLRGAERLLKLAASAASAVKRLR